MSIADKLYTVAENQQKVFDAGKKAEYDAFWDGYQQKGNRVSYAVCFAGAAWNDEVYNPKYPIVSDVSNYMFWQNNAITDTKVDITLAGTQVSNLFASCTKLKTIRKLIVSKALNTNMFSGCSSLANITFEGVIISELNMQACPLTTDSVQSIVYHLNDLTGATSLKLSLKSSVVLTDEQIAEIGARNWTLVH